MENGEGTAGRRRDQKDRKKMIETRDCKGSRGHDRGLEAMKGGSRRQRWDYEADGPSSADEGRVLNQHLCRSSSHGIFDEHRKRSDQ